MNRRGIGFGFCVIASFLYAVNYVIAATYLPRITSWNTPPGRLGTAYKAVGTNLNILALIALIVGIIYIVWGEIAESRKAKKA